ncbi:putative folate-biopterin transporter 2 [Zostera marina]|uniref:Putative folate-biopterin transporter 2 n=1 Tax=Zostera marina TaxID=29655 RepID=A0A0K9PRF0_ZOSMR|nr:putative folate-biopterin transporter 2 [Zostera marina]
MPSAGFSKLSKENGPTDTEQEEANQSAAITTSQISPASGLNLKLENGLLDFLFVSPVRWFRMLAEKIHWSFVVGVIVIYGASQGIGGSVFKVSSDYYWKDVQKIQPSEAQVYSGIISIPWIVKPLWGLLTDVLPVAGYKRRPYFVLAGILGVVPFLIISLCKKLHVVFALIMLTAGSAGVAIADVTIDACVAENSIMLPSLAADMQSLCGLSSSVGKLVGFSISGILIHHIGSQGVLGLLGIPAALVILVGIVMKETHTPDFAYGEVNQKLREASGKMVKTLKCRQVWRPCFYMFSSLALSLNIQEGLFYWYTDPKAGPHFSEEGVGFIFSFSAIGSLLGVLLYQNSLKDYPFRSLLFWSQLLFGFSGMLDLILVFRINLKLGIPDYFFVVIDECVSQMISRLKWMPLLVLSSKLCPSGVEGTFFALLMSIDNAGLLLSSWLGGLLMHLLNVTRTNFTNLWLSILIRNFLRILPLTLILLVPESDSNSNILPPEILNTDQHIINTETEPHNIELVSLVKYTS